ncbi:coatomer subunit beta'-1-like isoform X1 [Syzygium oleosum]|uniref:coatomer subunit beta'-1-like isoform X1 n=1 Tax=Syzygium oleosum TaxID=219896 RepID=UPI0024BA7F2C|nr:coatomer subunit beta'-1-like isoform X1 [Syzygium oleosum]
MSTAFKFENEIVQRSERAKSVEFHPTEPWILVSLHSGTVYIWNYQSQTIEKTFKVAESPVRSAKFILSKRWVIVGSDDAFIRVYDYGTMEKIKEFQAHTDFIRCVGVHPTLPYVLSASDDAVIKLWDWEKDWKCTQTFEGHSHYVMRVAFDPQDPNAFASASLDGTIKIWNVHSSAPKLTLDAHEKGLNFVDYFSRDDLLYLLSGSDDYTAKVRKDKGRSCVQTLEGHEHNVTTVRAHPELPIVITGSEDETLRIWDANGFRLKDVLKFGHGRIWDISYQKGSRRVAVACDKGIAVVEIVC